MIEKPLFTDTRTDEELLQRLLRSKVDAGEILSKIPLDRLDQAHRRELGITQKDFEKLQACIELGRRIHEKKSDYQTVVKISSSSDAIEFCKNHFSRLISDSLQEEFHAVTLDTKNKLIDTHRITVGTLDASLVHPREVFRPAIKDAASSVLLVHNHPSQDATPSREDYAVTDRLTEVGKNIGIDVLDHIVLGKPCKSIREER